MNILFKIISAFLYFNALDFVSPVQMYYIYDNPTVGFVSVDGGTYMQTGLTVGKPGKKQQFTGLYTNQKYQKINNENVVDSHFKVMKTRSEYTIPGTLDTGRLMTLDAENNKAQRIIDEYRKTAAPKQWQQKPQHQRIIDEYRKTEAPKQWQQKPQQQQMVNTVNSGKKDVRQITQISNNTPVRGDYGTKPKDVSSNNQQFQPIRPKAVNVDYSNSMKQRNQAAGGSKKNQDAVRGQRHMDVGRSQLTQDGAFDSKSAYIQMNVRKVSGDPQKKLLLNNNRQSTSLSLIAQDKRQRIPTSMMMDKTIHKANGIAHDHNMQVMSRVLEAMTQKIADRRHKKGEYVNSDTEKHLDIIYEKSKRSVVADNMRKYIGKDKIGKDLRNQQKQNSALARIGSHEASLEQDDTPYAVFYRMNPETLDRQEGFMIMKSLDAEKGSRDVASKEKRLHTAFQEDIENMTANQKSKNNGGGNLHRKTLKHFSNYRNH